MIIVWCIHSSPHGSILLLPSALILALASGTKLLWRNWFDQWTWLITCSPGPLFQRSHAALQWSGPLWKVWSSLIREFPAIGVPTIHPQIIEEPMVIEGTPITGNNHLFELWFPHSNWVDLFGFPAAEGWRKLGKIKVHPLASQSPA